MTFRFSNRVKVTASAPGTAAFPATASTTGFIGFNNIPSIANGDIVPYVAWDGGANWECGWGTYNTTGPVLTRTTITQNSAGTFVAINFSSGIVTIFCDATAASLALKDNNGDLAMGAGKVTGIGFLGVNASAPLSTEVAYINGTLRVGGIVTSGALSGATTINASGLITGAGGFYDQGTGTGYQTSGFGFSAYVFSTRLQSDYSGYAIVIASDERYKNFLEDDAAQRRANIVALHIGPFQIYNDLEKTEGEQFGFGVSAQQAYSLFGEGYLGVRPPEEEGGKWHAEASPTGLQALWAARQALIENDELRARLDRLEAAIAKLTNAKG